MIDENLQWLLSFYRTSEINGALFFGQLARRLKPGDIQMDLTHHFADEAQHARYWTDTLHALGAEPLKIAECYQDRYLKEAGLPVNLMEVLAVTLVFEQRVIRQYHEHLSVTHTQLAPVAETLERIMADERWHIAWVRKALATKRERHGDECVDAAIARFRAADDHIYESLCNEHVERLEGVMT